MQPSLSHSYVTVVPAYKAVPTDSEVLALAQLKRLSVENITLVCPNYLDISAYLALVSDLHVVRLPKEHFINVQSYNALMLQPWFYELFKSDYEWMLIHQLDAFLLSNQIQKFCELGYHYYGAPWLIGFPQYRFLLNRWPIKINRKRFQVGNGGLSLRHLEKTVDLLQRKQGHISNTFFMEDAFFGYWGSIDASFHACPAHIAAIFSLESHPENWIKLTKILPMGFHGHGIWSPDFYQPLLDEAYAKLSTKFPVPQRASPKLFAR
jgi:hypothetical protein